MNCCRLAAFVVAAFCLPLSGAGANSASDPAPVAGLAGRYDGSQTEIAAALELRPDGRFAYALSYGALDEQTEGIWAADGDRVLLTAPPVLPPRFVLLSQSAAPVGRLSVTLDVPDGVSRQYFRVTVRMADGTVIDRQLDEEQTPLAIPPGRQPAAITLMLPMFDVAGETIPLSGGGGHSLAFRFEPRDLGKPAFDHTPLARDRGDLILQRFDRTIRFRPIAR